MMMTVDVKKMKASRSHSWWFESHRSSPRSSPWLASTLAELDEKTREMLRLIEQDADSFAQRAEMYYRKRLELVNMVEDFYRTHRSLAERYDQLRTETGSRRSACAGHHPSAKRSWSEISRHALDKESRTSSISCGSEVSEVEDAEQDEESEVDSGGVSEVISWTDEKGEDEEERRDADAAHALNGETRGGAAAERMMTEELNRLREENRNLEARLLEKDEEKREVIRQLSMTVNILKDENAEIKRCLREEPRKRGIFEFKMLKKGASIPAKIFRGISRLHPAAAVAL